MIIIVLGDVVAVIGVVVGTQDLKVDHSKTVMNCSEHYWMALELRKLRLLFTSMCPCVCHVYLITVNQKGNRSEARCFPNGW